MEYQPDLKRITGGGGEIAAVAPGSIAAELGLQPGDVVLAVGDLRLRDVIDYRFAIAEETIELLVRRGDEEFIYEIEKDPDDDLGIEFVEPLFDRLRTCNNKCPFCFLTQMPKGLRRSLYLKDDDYRLGFLYGNFVTFTNLTEADWQRIEQQRLSPQYISVHATDRALRAVLLGKPDVPDVLEQIRRLGRIGVTVHTQIVALPQINDGEALHQSIRDLAALYPIVQTIAVVPVGLTKYRFEGKRPQRSKPRSRSTRRRNGSMRLGTANHAGTMRCICTNDRWRTWGIAHVRSSPPMCRCAATALTKRRALSISLKRTRRIFVGATASVSCMRPTSSTCSVGVTCRRLPIMMACPSIRMGSV
jgi:Fe-S oxidoreductase, related to NifB/MoaA family